jgi:D-serine deaminase-like pyridoxal phosphate-dependent protein
MLVQDLSTPALVVDADALQANIATMGAVRPGAALRPHVKAFKSTELARELAAAGHTTFCGATARELFGLAHAGLGEDLLLANQLLDRNRLEAMADLVRSGVGRVTVAVDSKETIDAAAAAGVREVLVDVDVGTFRGGCAPDDAGRLASFARRRGLEVRGVMGYEGHLMMEPDESRYLKVKFAMTLLRQAAAEVGGDVISGGGTGTWRDNEWVTELQAGSFALMDTSYASRGLPFQEALRIHATVLSVNAKGWAVADAGLKALGMDHGNPTVEGFDVLYCSDEHTTFVARDGQPLPGIGEQVRIRPAHVDPTVAYHEVFHVAKGDDVVATWPIDLRGW